MKKNWKIIIGSILLVGGFGCVASDIGSAVFGVIAGIALIAWWVLSRGDVKAKTAVTKTQAATPSASPSSPVAEVRSQPERTPTKFDVQIPETKDGAPIAYRYSVPFIPADPNVVLSVAQAGQWCLSAEQVGRDIHLFSGETDLGILTERSDMVSDWIKRGDPYLIILERVNSETECKATLVFYRDKQKHYAHKEQTLIPLTGYKAESKQDIILCLAPGDELEAEEDFDKEGQVTVSYSGDAIGSLPKKYACRFIEEGAALIVFDRGEDSDDGLITKPIVKVYW